MRFLIICETTFCGKNNNNKVKTKQKYVCHKPKINTINFEPVSERYVEKEGKT